MSLDEKWGSRQLMCYKHRMAKPDPHSLEAKFAAEERLALYDRVRAHLDAGSNALPPGLQAEDVRQLKSVAQLRGDNPVLALCRDWH